MRGGVEVKTREPFVKVWCNVHLISKTYPIPNRGSPHDPMKALSHVRTFDIVYQV